MKKTEYKNFTKPNETRAFPHGKVDLLQFAGGTIGRLTLQPGWRWSNDVKPTAKTDLCEAPHFQFQVSGKLHVVMENGQELDLGPGDVSSLASGHDAWVIGAEPVVLIDWFGATDYAKAAN